MENKLKEVRFRIESNLSKTNSIFEILFDFSNDSHHCISFKGGDSIKTIIRKLRLTALDLENNELFK